MTILTGSTKRGDWERRWGHELPRDWDKGRIHVEGDNVMSIPLFRYWVLPVVIGLCAWLGAYIFMSLGR